MLHLCMQNRLRTSKMVMEFVLTPVLMHVVLFRMSFFQAWRLQNRSIDAINKMSISQRAELLTSVHQPYDGTKLDQFNKLREFLFATTGWALTTEDEESRLLSPPPSAAAQTQASTATPGLCVCCVCVSLCVLLCILCACYEQYKHTHICAHVHGV